MNSTALKIVPKQASRVRRVRYTRNYTLSPLAHEMLDSLSDYYGVHASQVLEFVIRERYRGVERREKRQHKRQ